MDNQNGVIERKQFSNRPRWLTLCMMMTAASVLVLAGCGDNEDSSPAADEPVPLEQDATTQPEPSMGDEPAMEQDPGLGDDTSREGSMSPSEDAMPDTTMDEPAEGTMEPSEDEPGFGEGTDPMPGAEDDENATLN